MITVIKKFFEFSGEDNRKLLIKSVILGILNSLVTALKIPAVYIVIKDLIANNVTYQTLFISLSIMVVSIVIGIFISMHTTMLQTKAGYRVCANKRIEIAQHLRYLPMGWFNKNSLGEVTSVTTNTLESMSNVATRVIMLSTKGFITSFIITLMMCVFDIRIGLITIIGLTLFMIVNSIMQRNELNVSTEKMEADEMLVSKILEYIRGITEIKNFNLTSSSITNVRHSIDRARDVNIKMELISIKYIYVQSIINKLTGVTVCLVSLMFYFNDTLSLQYCIMLVICSFILLEQLDSVGSYSSLLKVINIGMDKVNAILETKVMDSEGKDIIPNNYNITLNNVDFSYENKKVINNVSLNIKENTTVAFVGESGSGKTTLCHLMARFWDVNKGEVLLGNVNVKDYTFDSLIKNFSFVFQDTYLFSDTILNNIKFGKENATDEEVIEAAKKAQCHDFILSLPNGYDTVIGEGGASLSGGEKQRITIARAIMKDAPIIILDEATANVDPENELEITKAIEALTKNKTIIMIAHKLKTIRNADVIYVINDGKIAQKGKHDELIKEDGIYKNYINQREKAMNWNV